MKLREYEYLLAIASEENMSRAAQKLFISQPALSKLLANVEADLGVTLFEQRSRRMIPTAAGRVYLENARKIVEMNEKLETEVRNVRTHPEVSLAYPFVYSSYISNTLLPALFASDTDILLHGHVVPQASLHTGFVKESWTLAFGQVTQSYTHTLQHRTVGEQETVLAIPKGHPLEQLACSRPDCTFPYIEPQALADVPFLLSRPNSYSGRLARNYFDANHIAPNTIFHTSLTGSLYTSIASGMGVAMVPSVPLRHMGFEDRITYLSIDTTAQRKPIAVLFQKDHPLSPQEERLISIIQNTYMVR